MLNGRGVPEGSVANRLRRHLKKSRDMSDNVKQKLVAIPLAYSTAGPVTKYVHFQGSGAVRSLLVLERLFIFPLNAVVYVPPVNKFVPEGGLL